MVKDDWVDPATASWYLFITGISSRITEEAMLKKNSTELNIINHLTETKLIILAKPAAKKKKENVYTKQLNFISTQGWEKLHTHH